jgi:hypothetical protein
MSHWQASSWSSNQPWEEEDLQESRGRRAREARKARRRADAGVQERAGWHEQGWVANHEPMLEMTPGSQRWRKLKELEKTVNNRDKETTARAEAWNIAASQLACVERERDQAWRSANDLLQVQRAQHEMEIQQLLHQLNTQRDWLEQQKAELAGTAAANKKQRVDLTAWMRQLEAQRAEQELMAQTLQRQREQMDHEGSVLFTAAQCTSAIVEQLRKDQEALEERERLMAVKQNAPWRQSKVELKRMKDDVKDDLKDEEETPVPTAAELEALRAMRLVTQPRSVTSPSRQASGSAGPLPAQVCPAWLPLQPSSATPVSLIEADC